MLTVSSQRENALVSAAITTIPQFGFDGGIHFFHGPGDAFDGEATDDVGKLGWLAGLDWPQQDAVPGVFDGEVGARRPVMLIEHRLGQDDLAFGGESGDVGVHGLEARCGKIDVSGIVVGSS
jgi:hypothetical protein